MLILKTIAKEKIRIEGLPVFLSKFWIIKVPTKLPIVEQIVQINPYLKFIIPIIINWIVVEEEVNKTKKFDVAVEIIGLIPISKSIGPNTSPPPIPKTPAKAPPMKAYIGYFIITNKFHFISVGW